MPKYFAFSILSKQESAPAFEVVEKPLGVETKCIAPCFDRSERAAGTSGG